jgi:hypothetical protein
METIGLRILMKDLSIDLQPWSLYCTLIITCYLYKMSLMYQEKIKYNWKHWSFFLISNKKTCSEHFCKLCFGLPQGAVSLVLDSLDDIHCLQEAPLNDRDFLHSVLEDRQLHALLEVSTYFSSSILCMVDSPNYCSNNRLYSNTAQTKILYRHKMSIFCMLFTSRIT